MCSKIYLTEINAIFAEILHLRIKNYKIHFAFSILKNEANFIKFKLNIQGNARKNVKQEYLIKILIWNQINMFLFNFGFIKVLMHVRCFKSQIKDKEFPSHLMMKSSVKHIIFLI